MLGDTAASLTQVASGGWSGDARYRGGGSIAESFHDAEVLPTQLNPR